MKYITREVKIAVAAIVAVVCVVVLINFLKGINILESSNTFYVRMADCQGLQVSSPVYANGYPVGVVRSIDYNYSDNHGVVATIELDREMRLPIGTAAELESSLMGGVKVKLVMGDNPTKFLSPRDTIVGAPEHGLMAKAGDMIPVVEQMLPKLDSILANLNTLTSDPALRATLHNLQAMSADLALTASALPATMKQVDGMATHFNSISGKIDNLDFAATMASVNGTISDAQRLITHLDGVSQSLDHKMNSKDNTLGLFMSDTSVHDNLNHTIQSADSLVTDLKAHPKRYVHFSIFGKKDK